MNILKPILYTCSAGAYKTIGEVAEILELKSKTKGVFSTHTIRFWETQFKQIKPKLLNSNRRYYDKETIDILKFFYGARILGRTGRAGAYRGAQGRILAVA